MKQKLSSRLLEIIEALPLRKGMHVLEIGCGTGAMAVEIAERIGEGFVLGIDRSPKAIVQAMKNSKADADKSKIKFEQVAIENFGWEKNAPLFDIAVAIRVGALDGRHPEIHQAAMKNIARAVKLDGKLLIDGGNPLKEIKLDEYREG